MHAQPWGSAPPRLCHRPAPPAGHRRAANPTAARPRRALRGWVGRRSRSAIDDSRRPRTCSGRLVRVVGELVLGGGVLRHAKHRPESMGQKGALVANSRGVSLSQFLCVRCKDRGASRAAHAQCAYPILSAKRRHQLRHVDHRVGGPEHLRQHRQSARGEHKGSAAAGPLRLVRAARQDALAHGACGMRIPWPAAMAQRPHGPRREAGAVPHLSVKTSACLLNNSTRGFSVDPRGSPLARGCIFRLEYEYVPCRVPRSCCL